MKFSLSRKWIAAGIIQCAIVIAAPVACADSIWRNDWTVQAPPILDPPYFAAASADFASNGDVILHGLNSYPKELQLTRVATDGTLRWSANIGSQVAGDYAEASAVIATSDGGAISSLLSSFPSINRLDADGQLVWTRDLGVLQLVLTSGNRLAAQNCYSIYLMDDVSGNVIWSRQIPTPLDCPENRLLVDAQSNIYAISIRDGLLHLTRFDVNGNQAWDVAAGPTNGRVVSGVGAGSSHLFVQLGSELRAFGATDGALAWSADFPASVSATMSTDATPEPVVWSNGSMQRLAAATGAVRWTRAFASIANVASLNDSLLLREGTNLVKLNSLNGTSAWVSPLPLVDSFGQLLTWRRFGGLADGKILGTANVNPGPGSASGEPRLRQIDFASGAMLAELAVPGVDHGLDASSAVSGDRAFNAAYFATSEGVQLRVRSIEISTGSTLWDVSGYLALSSLGYEAVYRPEIAADEDSVAVVSRHRFQPFPNPPVGGLQVDLFDRGTGSLLWTRVLHEDLQGDSTTSGPKFDADGNVYVDIDTTVQCGPSTRCAIHRLYKFMQVDGSIAWSRDGAAGNYELFGNDVLMPGAPGDSSASLSRLAGSSGAVMWASNELLDEGEPFGLVRLDAQHVDLIGASHHAKIDVTDGSTVWSVANQPYNCATTCYVNDGIVLANGDLLQVGEGGSLPYVRRAHMDGSGTVEEWHPAGNPALLRSNLTRVWRNSAEELSVSLAQTLRSTRVYLGFIAHLDPVTGSLSEFQSRGAFPVDDGSRNSLFHFLNLASDHQILGGYLRQQPTLPSTTGIGLFDASIAAHGDLAASMIVDDGHAFVGGSLGFELTVNYTGDLPLSGAHLVASLPKHGSSSPLVCSTAGASNCVSEDRFGGISTTFDIQPGGSITIAGQLQGLDGDETDWIGIGTFGPTSLSEPGTVNNFARRTVVQSLFKDGFEG